MSRFGWIGYCTGKDCRCYMSKMYHGHEKIPVFAAGCIRMKSTDFCTQLHCLLSKDHWESVERDRVENCPTGKVATLAKP